MPYKIGRRSDNYVVYNPESGKVYGSHSAKSAAKAQLRALYANTDEFKEGCSKLKEYLKNHYVLKDLKEDEMDEIVYDVHSKQKDFQVEKLEEYVDMYLMGANMSGPNRGDSTQYGQSGLGYSNSGYSGNGIGNFGTPSRQGTRVYGYDNVNGLTPGDGEATIIDRDEKAVVVVPEKKDNYEPWKVELADNGEKKTKIEKNKTPSITEEMSGPMGDIITGLELYGVDVEKLMKKTGEEIQDTLIRLIKREKVEAEKEKLNESVKNIKAAEILIAESFNGDILYEFGKGTIRRSRIQDARDILAKKHGQKKAHEKIKGRRAYVLDRYAIDKLMRQYGYVYSIDQEKWIKRKVKPVSGGGSKETSPKQVANKIEPDEKEKSNDDTEDSDQKEIKKNREISGSSAVDDIITNPLLNPEIKEKIKDNQGRYILAVAYDIKDAVTFKEPEAEGDEEMELIPIMEKSSIYSELEKRGFVWNSHKIIWEVQDSVQPEGIFKYGDTRSSLIARGYLASITDVDKSHITLNYEGIPHVSPSETNEDMNENNFVWDESIGWKLEKNIEESILLEADKKVKDWESLKKELGYSITLASEYSARFYLRALQIEKYKDLKAKNDPTAPSYLDDISNKLPTQAKTHGRFDVTLNEVEDELTNFGAYQHEYGSGGYYWSDNREVPSLLEKEYGETLESYIGRGIASVKNAPRANEYIGINFDDTTNKSFPKTPNREIVRVLKEESYVWSTERGWIPAKASGIDADEHNDIFGMSKFVTELHQKEKAILNKYQNADYDALTFGQKREYADALAAQKTREVFAISPKEWSEMGPAARKKKTGEMNTYYKFDPKIQRFRKRENPAIFSVRGGGYVNMKNAGLKLGSKLGKLFTGTLGFLGRAVLDLAIGIGSEGTKNLSDLKPKLSK